MGSSPERRLYRKTRPACQGASKLGMRYRRTYVIAILCACLLSTASAQVAKRRTVSKGPRALGLIEVDSKGRGHLMPITIMLDGRFYDASAYKADPIPMAVQPGTVYEGMKAGVSQGLFTVNNTLPHNGWLGLGNWKSHEQIEAEKDQAKARADKLAQKAPEDDKAGGPPRLSRTPEGAHPKATDAKTSDQSKTADDDEGRPKLKKKSVDSQPSVADSGAASLAAAEAGRPVLRRQLQAEEQEQTKIGPDTEPLKGTLQLIPAISDAEGPQPRPYTFETKPEENEAFMKKMSAMAAEEVKHRIETLSGNNTKTKTGRPSAPELHDPQLKVLDISGTNEAVLIYSAIANSPGRQFSTTVVARQDIYGDLHKIFAHTTDNNHLDVQPRYEFIDAVDADGDGRGELLFRQVGESGSGFAIYRVIGDRLWPLFESKPGS